MIISSKHLLSGAVILPMGILFTTTVMAETCTSAPDCAALGYTKSSSDCPDGGIKCPFDTSKYYCPSEKAPECPIGSYKDCEAIHDYWRNDFSTQTSLADGTKCYQCRSAQCSDFGYLDSKPSDSLIGSGCNYKSYTSCTMAGVDLSNGRLNCYDCVPNKYGYGRGLLVTCSGTTYCCGSGGNTIGCSNVISGLGGCIKY